VTAVEFRALVESSADVVAVFAREHGALERETGVR
jgi:hypothetical protein